MCGLFGVFTYGKTVKGAFGINKLVEALGHGSAVRGTHATGISYVEDGNVYIAKAPTSSYKFDAFKKVPAGTKAVMGHTRHTTQGSEKDNYNNHPFPGTVGKTKFTFAHNGVLDNDYELQSLYKLPKTEIKTDSYVAVQLLERNKKLTTDAIIDMAQTVEGMFAFTLLTNRNELYIIKNDSPMNIVHFPSLRMYVYASTADILHNALFDFSVTKELMLSVLRGDEQASDVIEYIDLKQGDIALFRQDGTVQYSKFKPQERYSKYANRHNSWLKQQANGGYTSTKPTTTSTYNYGYGYGSSWDDEVVWNRNTSLATTSTNTSDKSEEDWYLEYLQNYAYSLGYDADDITQVIKAGATTDEIEDAMYAYDLDTLFRKYKVVSK